MNWQGKKVAVLGYGHEGQAMTRFALQEGAEVTVCDIRPDAKDESATVSWQLGEGYLKNLNSFDVIVRSPGIPYFSPEIQEAKAAGVEVTSQVKEFFKRSPARIIGVTGTKGKGTTATLIHQMLEVSGVTSYLVGNIGESAISRLPKLQSTDQIVYELSSFQLQDLDRSPDVAVVLGITVDHQDHHRSIDEYIEAKRSIVANQSTDSLAIINVDYPASAAFVEVTAARVLHVSMQTEVAEGAYVKDGNVHVRINGQEAVISGETIALPGVFNLENVCAATATARAMDISLDAIQSVLQKFTGLPHRLAKVAEVDGVEYWNNSYGTTPETTSAALGAFKTPIVLMLGGFEKGFSYEGLGAAIIESTVKKIVGIGENIGAMYAAVETAAEQQGKKAPDLVLGGATMSDMVRIARECADSGGVVLLSPAAASFDKFQNVKDRGEQFEKAVKELSN